ncbi:MAG TPA: PDZ domain-containing protein [Candidatus Acidoferrum sp.]|nr:PDZ domain-containing protein [Candidatus Acidoferrum sp.]
MNIACGNLWSGMVRLLAASAALALWPCVVHAGGGDGRIWLKSTINGKPARLGFDTGAGIPVLFGSAAKKFGLSVTNWPNAESLGPDVIQMMTGECTVKIDHSDLRTWFGIVDVPQGAESDADGVIGWLTLKHNIIAVDAIHETVSFLNSLPRKAAGWTKFSLVTNSHTLMMTVPRAGGTPYSVLVDTGSLNGVDLFPDQWQEWKTAHADQPVTIGSYYNASDGFVVTEEGWAKILAIGSLGLTNVPVMKADKLDLLHGSTNTVAMLGMEALKRFDLVIDGKRGFAYLHAKEGPPPPYEYNRLGAVFASPDLESENLMASVVAGSPAWEAGIRPGDVLTRVGNMDVRNWRKDPTVVPRLWTLLRQPPGTKLEITVRRGEDQIIVHPILRQILSPEAK